LRRGTHFAVILVALGLAALGLATSCGRQPNVPDASSSDDHAKEQKLPFDRESRANGVSPSRSLIPAATRLPEGQSIAIRLHAPLSSASAHVGETFDGTIDEPVVNDGQTLVPRGAAVVGRVLASKRSEDRESGYLRVALVSIQAGGKTVLLDTSSIFAKGGSRDGSVARDVVFAPDRRLTFHLTQGVDLP
jgi:hypothetical protein